MKRILYGLILFCLASPPCFGDGIDENGKGNDQNRHEQVLNRRADTGKEEAAGSGDPVFAPIARRFNEQKLSSAAAEIDAIIVADLKANNQRPTPPASEFVLLRRVYLDVVGRIPTADEMDRYLASEDPDRLNVLIDELLDSPGQHSHLFNYLADMLRISDGFYRVGATHSYQSWLKKQIRENRPWDELVSEMMTAEGSIGNTGPAGYLLRDAGMPLDSLSNTLTTFLGANVACAQCHDHPFADWSQEEFFQMAAFFGSTRFERDDSRKPAKVIATKEFGKAALVTLLQSNLSRVVFEQGRSLKYPEDYVYDDDLPGTSVTPMFISWADTPTVPVVADTSDPRTLRKQFAAWLTAKENPRFASAIANRMWKRFFGAAVQEPITDLDQQEQATNPRLIAFLSRLMRSLDYDLREFQRVLLRTNIYRGRASHTPAEGVAYRFPGPLLRRMTAEQAWDSLVTLNVGLKKENDVRDYGAEMAELVIPAFDIPAERQGWNREETREQVFDHARKVLKERGVSSEKVKAGGRGLFLSGGKTRGIQWNRASELVQPEKPDHLLRIAGQSDRSVADDNSTEGGITESLAMMNGRAVETVIGPESRVMRQVARRSQHMDQIDFLYRSLLTRQPNEREKGHCERAFQRGLGADDIAWALLNSREFMYIQ